MSNFIDPKTIAKINDLPLIAKKVAEGFLQGLQPSQQRGIGLEFSQYRPYQDGDAINQIDWKLFARSDRYYIREADRESEINVWFLLDASASMLQRSDADADADADAEKTSISKFDYAKYLIASMSYLAHRQGDSVGLLSYSNESVNYLPCANTERHWRKLLLNLASTKSQGQFVEFEKIKRYFQQLNKPSLIFILSDFNQNDQEITSQLSHLNSQINDVTALQLVCQDELNFDYQGAIRFKDLETGEELLLSGKQAKIRYQSNYKEYQAELSESFKRSNIELKSFNIDQPLDEVLYQYLKKRINFSSQSSVN
jgi:uncharacterized protein (DUF58 family)